MSLLQDNEQRITGLYSRLLHLLEPIETSRVQIRKRSRIFWPITVLILVITIPPILALEPPTSIFLGIGIAVIVLTIYYFRIGAPQTALINDFNQNIVPHIVAEFLSESKFEANNYISRDRYYTSGLFKTPDDRYTGSNYISGYLGKTSLCFSNLHSEYKTETHSKNGGTQTTWYTIFEGIFLIADSNKHFQGNTYILPDKAERRFGNIGKRFQEKFGSKNRGELVYMENPAFEKLFVVYATDPIEARYLLTPNMQQYFVDLAEYLGKDSIHASFVNDKLHLAISCSLKLFDFKMKKSLTDAETMKHYTQDLLYILNSIEILNLNTRIWGK